MSFGPVSWLYQSEIFPNRIRELALAIGTSTQWLFNFVFSQATPHAVDNLGWKTFLMFCIFNYALVVYVWFFIKEVCRTAPERDTKLTYQRLRASPWKTWKSYSDRRRLKVALPRWKRPSQSWQKCTMRRLLLVTTSLRSISGCFEREEVIMGQVSYGTWGTRSLPTIR